MPTRRKNQFLFTCLLTISILSFIYLNFYGITTAESISATDISKFEAVESTSFPEIKAAVAVFSRVMEIVTLK